MNIFISHSSKDKWAARRISEDLQQHGHEVFVDEKDIKTGESIDHAIKQHLGESEHFLILLSPASLKSEWVLMELGGAMALGKTIIPILLYVGANEMPQAINLKLARDINDVEKYYDEISGKPKDPPKSKTAQKNVDKKAAPKGTSFQEGDNVKVISSEPADALRDTGLSIYWHDEMNTFLGQKANVTSVNDEGVVIIDIAKNYGWAPEWLIHDRS